MQTSNFNFASVFSIMVLLVFSYITFLGLVYWKEGELFLPLVLTLSMIVIVIGCVFVMCLSKATRWKRIGTIGQIFFGIIILATLLLAAFPFTNFLRVAEASDDIKNKIATTCDAAVKLDEAYEEYVNTRLDNYKSNLVLISKGRNINPSQYKECLGGASGSSDEAKIESLKKSLKNKLYPDSTSNIVKERHEWLDKARNANVWNPLTSSNISKVNKSVEGWQNNYKQLSSVSYKGEESEPFAYEEFSSQLKELTKTYAEFQRPSFFSVIISLICFFIMMLPYIITRESLAGAVSKGNRNSPLYE